MANFRKTLERLADFFQRGIWEVEFENLSRFRSLLMRQVQLVLVVLRGFIADRCILRASALTYFTLLSIVPLLALAFSLAKGLGVQRTLQPLIIEQLTLGMEEVNYIITYIEATNVGTLGAAGLIFLLLTVFFLLGNIEESFNEIWGIRETRPALRRFADFFSVLVIAPVFVFAAISMTSALQSHALVQRLLDAAVVGEVILALFRFLPYFAMWAAFTFLYVFMPNIKVSLKAALIGGILGGTLWQLAQWGYVAFQFGMARYNAIYGTMAALPIFMVWIYTSWVIVLLGAEVAYAVQNIDVIRQEKREQKINFLSQELTALAVLLTVARIFQRGGKPWNLVRITAELQLPPRLTRQILDILVRLGFLTSVAPETIGEEAGYQPAYPPEKMPVIKVLQALREDGTTLNRQEPCPAAWTLVKLLEDELRQADDQALGGRTIGDLVRGLEGVRSEE